MTEKGDVKQHLPVLAQGSLIARIEDIFKDGRGSIRLLVVSEMGTGRELVIDYKRIDRGIRTEDKFSESPTTSDSDENEDESDDTKVDVYAFFEVGEESGVQMNADNEEAQRNTLFNPGRSFPDNSTAFDVHPIEFQGRTRLSFNVVASTTDSSPALFRWMYETNFPNPLGRYSLLTMHVSHMKRSMMQFNELKVRWRYLSEKLQFNPTYS